MLTSRLPQTSKRLFELNTVGQIGSDLEGASEWEEAERLSGVTEAEDPFSSDLLGLSKLLTRLGPHNTSQSSVGQLNKPVIEKAEKERLS